MKKFHLILVAFLLSFTSYAQIVLPLDFESTSVTYSFTDFAGGAVTVIPNAQANGINTSSKVAQMIKSVGQTYGGSFISLTSPIDFSVNRTFKMKVFSPRVGAKFLLKVENEANAAINFERQVVCTVANQWEDLSFDFSAISTTNQYQKMVFIFDNGTMGDGTANFTYLFDDVRLVAGGGGPSLTQMNLPVTFDLTTVDYGLIGFGGAEQSSIVTDPTNATNKVAKVIKSAAAELWAGTTVTGAAGLGFSSRIPFTASSTKLSVRVWSPDAGIPVRLKVEEHGDPTHSVETEATVTTASGWQVLEFNFANQAAGTAALNLGFNYDKASIFFNFGTTGAIAGEKTYYFDDVQFGTGGGSALTQMNLPVTFDLTTVDYGLIGFGGAEQSSIVADPTNASNKVAKVIKTAAAELWAGTTVTAAAGLGFATRIPFTASNTKMSVRVWSPNAGIPVRLKAEEHGDGTHSVETEATVTLASGWQTLEFNFANQSAGTSALNLAYNYDKVSIFFNFGTTGAVAGEKIYYFDDIQFVTGGGGGPLTQMNLPVTFDLTTVDYGLIGFGGAEQSSIVADPTNASNKVAKVIKTAAAELWAGTTVTAAAGLGFATRIPFTASNTKMSVRVWSPNAGIPVRLKAEEHGDGTHSVETEATVTLASGWQTLEFNFANQSAGTSALNLAYNYDKVSIFFNFGTTGAVAGEKTYYFDDIQFVTGGGGGPLTQMDLPVNFDLSTVDYGLIGFGGAEQSSIVADPTNAANKVAKVIKTATAELWAGTTVTAAAGLGFATRIPFTASNTKMSVRVWSPNAGIPVRLKAEEHGDGTHSVETEATVTMASGWQTLEFNFANQSTGTSALNLAYNYDKVSIFFNFGTTGAAAGEKIYYFDDVEFVTGGGGGGGSTNPVLPLDFQSSTITYTFNDFDGGGTTVISNPQSSGINTSSKVAKMVKSTGQPWGGSWIALDAPIDFSTNRTFKMKVYSPRVGAKVLLKVENMTDAAISFEKEVLTTTANAWEDLTFNYSAISTTNQYQKLVFIFDNGTIGDGSANFTFLFDDVRLTTTGGGGGGGGTTLTQMNLPVNFDLTTVEYGLIGFGGAEQSSIVADPTNATNKVAKVIKSATAEVWAGTTITAAAGLGFSSRIPFTATDTKMTVRVWAPQANIPVRLKVEDHTTPTHSVETEAMVTVASGWQILEFNFAQPAQGTAALNLSYNYDKASIFFNFGTSGAVAGEQTYYFDDVKFATGGGLIAYPELPLDFQSTTISYSFIDFDGGAASVINNPQSNGINTSTKVAKMVKNPGQPWGGSLLIMNGPIDFSVNRIFKMKVYSPRVGAKVLLKAENLTDGAINFEKEAITTVANTWEELSFDFNAINIANQYQKLVFIFENGTVGDGSANFTFLFDDVKLVYGNSGNITLTQMDLPLTFDNATVDYGFIGFNGAEQSSVVTDPTNASNKVGKVVKSATASADAGTVITAAAGLGFVNHVPFSTVNTDITVRVWAPEAGIPVRLKLEDHTDATHYVETEATVSTAAGWQTLAFNFANQVTGTPALNLTYNYDKATIYFNYGTTGAVAGEKTYYFDDMQFVADAVPGNPDDVLNNIVVYPNPFVTDVYIRNVTLTPLDIRLSDASGRILGRFTSSVTNIDINMSKYPSGVYFIAVENKLNNKIITKKVIKK